MAKLSPVQANNALEFLSRLGDPAKVQLRATEAPALVDLVNVLQIIAQPIKAAAAKPSSPQASATPDGS